MTVRKRTRLIALLNFTAPAVMVVAVSAGIMDPSNAPAPTMYTLTEIYQKQADTYELVEAMASPQSLAPTTAVVQTGYYEATTLDAVDGDLTAGNIREGVVIFGITGTHSGGQVPKTGQTNTLFAGDDGEYESGAVWPGPRFTIQAETNVVKDNLTGLLWARNANQGGAMNWTNALIFCEALSLGGFSDWRLPNVRELESLVNYGASDPALPAGYPFTAVQSDYYWSGSSYFSGATFAWGISIYDGNLWNEAKTALHYVWPVRGP